MVTGTSMVFVYMHNSMLRLKTTGLIVGPFVTWNVCSGESFLAIQGSSVNDLNEWLW